MIRAGNWKKDETTERLDPILRQGASISFCDTYSFSTIQKTRLLERQPDHVHPDIAGYRKMGEAVAETIQKEWDENLTNFANPTV